MNLLGVMKILAYESLGGHGVYPYFITLWLFNVAMENHHFQ
jgi:hypothetical protein